MPNDASMTDEQLSRLTDEFLNLEYDRSAVLIHLSYAELEAAHNDILKQLGLELAIGVWENSEWFGSKLVIDANEGPISFSRRCSMPSGRRCGGGKPTTADLATLPTARHALHPARRYIFLPATPGPDRRVDTSW